VLGSKSEVFLILESRADFRLHFFSAEQKRAAANIAIRSTASSSPKQWQANSRSSRPMTPSKKNAAGQGRQYRPRLPCAFWKA
jgi:hypothetical protein